jgi:peptide/nickel transport system substrate-binding protein
MLKAKPWLVGAFSCVVCLMVGCNPGDGNPATGRSKTMILHLPEDPAGLNPVNTVGATTVTLHNLLFEHLIALDPKTLQLTPRLAEAMPTVSEDKLSFTFKLRKGLHFADGMPLTSKDVVFSFKALMNPFVSSAPRRAELQNFMDCIAHDEHTVEFKLKDSGPFNLNRLAINFFVIPKHIYDPNNLSDGYTTVDARNADQTRDTTNIPSKAALITFADFFEDQKFQREKGYIVGSGRYVFDGWKSGQYVRFVKNEHYWNAGSSAPFDQQGMDTLTYKIIPDNQTALQALKSGEIDFSDNFDPNQYKEEMTGESFDRHFGKVYVPYPFYEYIGWNQNIKGAPTKTFFADTKVRHALSRLVDVDEIVQNLLFGTAKPITSMVYYDRPEYNKNLHPIKYNEAEAKQMLTEAGWTDSDGNGTLDKMVQGKQEEFAFTLCYRRGNELRKSIARHVQDKFKRVGISVEVQDLDGSILLERLKQHEIEAWIGGWVYDSDEQDLFSLFHSSQILNGGYNWGSYHNPSTDSLMEQIVVEWDTEKRFEMHRKVQQNLYDDQPYTLLFANAARIGWNKRLENIGWYSQRPCYDPGQFYLAKEK